MAYSLNEICKRIQGRLEGDEAILIQGVNTLDSAGAAEITFAESDRYFDKVASGQAAAIVVAEDFPDVPGCNLVRVPNPRFSFMQIMEMFVAPVEMKGIHQKASISDTANLDKTVSIGACAVVADLANIGARTFIESGAYIGTDVIIGEDCYIGANAVLMKGIRVGDRVVIHAGATIGGEGFGFAWLKDHHHKVPQLGSVQIDDDVEIGCNSCVDRATMGITRIRRGTKIDNQVHIAHNNDIGEDVIIAGQFGSSGSVTIGNRAVFGGKSCIADHLSVGENAQVGGASVVIKNVEPGAVVFGMPAQSKRQTFQELAYIKRLPDLAKTVKAQEKELKRLQKQVASLVSKLPQD